MSSYFSLPSFARAKQNKAELEKKNPQNPVLKDEDEQFLHKQITNDDTAPQAPDAPVSKITESGEEEEVSKEEAEQVGAGADQFAIPEVQPETGDGAQESKPDVTEASKPEATEDAQAPKPNETTEESVDDPPEEVPDETTVKSDATADKPKKSKKKKSFDLPSQEEAEAATKNFNAGTDGSGKTDGPGEKKTWASYLPSIGSKKDQGGEKKADTGVKTESSAEKSDMPTEEKPAEEKPAEESRTGEQSEPGDKRTWAGYASTAYSSLPSISSIPSLPAWKSKDKDGKGEPVLNEDGSINDDKTKEKQESEVSVLLDKLDMSSINNRVFAFSGETQKIYARFAEILRDTMNGGPTAYEDMEKLMKDAGPQLEKQFQSMPPFVQTLVKSLPAKMGSTLGPELLAAASEKPGADMKTRMAAASKEKSSGGDGGINVASSSSDAAEQDGQKKKRKIPGLKSLMSGQGAVASILRSIVSFLTTRFPFLASSVNVVMSLAVFILMFVFWYCHKRGKEMRLAKQAEAREKGEEVPDDEEEGELEVDATDEDEPPEYEGVEEKDGAAAESKPASAAKQEDSAEAVSETAEKAKEEVVDKSEPAEAPVPEQSDGAKGAELEAEKAVGV
ncbi:hypothetical protein LTR08_001327 [Meristemomyces frigidus]|nr:hypothetical protein LTR08_001327 [Meristemomyces frigidus]